MRNGGVIITVYIITNTVTGRRYVGLTNSLEGRIKNHFYNLQCGKHNEQMQEDYDTYGRESFVVTVFGTGYNNMNGRQKEVFLMHVLRTNEREYGYNYKDKVGTGPGGVKSRWRVPPRIWNLKEEDQNYYMYLWSLPLDKRARMTKKKYLRFLRKEEKEKRKRQKAS